MFAFFGIAVAALVLAAEREPRILLALFILFLCFQLFFLGFLLALDDDLVGALPWWNIAIANLLASVAMLIYFFLRHRSLGHPAPGALDRGLPGRHSPGAAPGILGVCGPRRLDPDP